MENNKAFTLINSGKISFFLLPLVPTNHKYWKNKKNFFVNKVEGDVASPIPSSEELYDVVSQYEDIIFDFQF